MNKGDIYFVEIPATDGHEQSGLRPVIVLSEVDAGIVIVVPFTSNLQALKYVSTVEVCPSKKNGLKSDSVALVFQLRAIDKKRLKNRIGVLETNKVKLVDQIIRKILNV